MKVVVRSQLDLGVLGHPTRLDETGEGGQAGGGGAGTVTPHLQDLNPESRPGSYSHSDDSLPCYPGLPSIFYTACKRGCVSLLWVKGMGYPREGVPSTPLNSHLQLQELLLFSYKGKS